jgi:hypothetical protein
MQSAVTERQTIRSCKQPEATRIAESERLDRWWPPGHDAHGWRTSACLRSSWIRPLSFDLLGWLSISSGWPVVLSSLKALLESGEALLLQA